MQLNLDGEFGGVLPAHFQNRREFLKVRVPEEFYEQLNGEETEYSLPDPEEADI